MILTEKMTLTSIDSISIASKRVKLILLIVVKISQTLSILRSERIFLKHRLKRKMSRLINSLKRRPISKISNSQV